MTVALSGRSEVLRADSVPLLSTPAVLQESGTLYQELLGKERHGSLHIHSVWNTKWGREGVQMRSCEQRMASGRRRFFPPSRV